MKFINGRGKESNSGFEVLSVSDVKKMKGIN
jgi:hypothetical protein